MGSLYKRRQRDGTRGGVWWCKFYVDGRPVRESTGMVKEQEARRFLKAREGCVALGQPLLPRADRVRYDEIAADLRRHYETTGTRGLNEADDRLKPLAKFFKGRRVVTIDSTLAEQYVVSRQAQGAANSTINRELSILVKMLRFSYANQKLLRLPIIRKLKEPPPRKGFFERDSFEAVRRRLSPDLQLAISIAYTYGWRMQSEVLTLERRQVDLESGTLRLEPGMTKNNEGRVVYLTEDLKVLVAGQIERIRDLERRLQRIIPHLFPHSWDPAVRTTDPRFPLYVENCVYEGRTAGDVTTRLPADGGQEHGEQGHPGARRDDGDGAPKPFRLRSLSHRVASRPPRGCA